MELTKKGDEAQAKIDTLTEEVEKLKTDNATLSDPAGEKIQKIIADRKALEETAAKVDVKTDGLSDKDVKVAVIQKQSPEFKSDDRSDDYINARFDFGGRAARCRRKRKRCRRPCPGDPGLQRGRHRNQGSTTATSSSNRARRWATSSRLGGSLIINAYQEMRHANPSQ